MSKSLKTILGLLVTLLALYAAVTLSLGGWGQKQLPNFLTIPKKPFLFGHQGVNDKFPGNTIGSFATAAEHGYPGLEMDIQYSADGRFFVFHNYTLDESLGLPDTPSVMNIRQITNIPLAISDSGDIQFIPSLDSVITRWGREKILFLDMKGYGHSSFRSKARDIINYIHTNDLHDKVLVASVSLKFLFYLKWLEPTITTIYQGPETAIPWFIGLVPSDLRPDLYCNYYTFLDQSAVAEIIGDGLLPHYIAHHVDSTNLQQTLDWSVPFIVTYHCPLADSVLIAQ